MQPRIESTAEEHTDNAAYKALGARQPERLGDVWESDDRRRAYVRVLVVEDSSQDRTRQSQQWDRGHRLQTPRQ
jgi:hypothetical protein